MSLLNSYLAQCKREEIGKLSDLLLSFDGVEAYIITDKNFSLTVVQTGTEFFQVDFNTVEPYCLTDKEEAETLSKKFEFYTYKNELVNLEVKTLKEYVKRRTDELLQEISFIIML